MPAPPPDPSADPSSRTGATSALVLRLAGEMEQRWREGERPRAEDFLARDPGLWHQPDVALELVYEEFCLRQRHGPPADPAEFLGRFPQWRAELEVLLDCHRLLERAPDAPRLPAVGESLG